MTTAKRTNPTLRFLDRYVGVAALLGLGAVKRRRERPSGFGRIGLLKSAAIGDTLLLSGIVRDVASQLTGAEVVLITGTDNHDAGALIAPQGVRHITISVRKPAAAVRALRRERLDALVDFGAWPRFDALLTALSGSSFTVGFRTPGQSRHYCYDRVVEHSDTSHELENYRQIVAELGVRSTSAPRVAPQKVVPADRLPLRPFVVFHPWSGGFSGERKEWPIDRWVALGARMRNRGWSIVVTGGRASAARNVELVAALRREGCAAHDAAGAYTLAELTDVLAASECVVSVNTGIMHLAALVGAATVSLEGPTPVHRWGPVGPRVSPVRSTFADCGFLNLGFEYAGRRADCMLGISVDAVDDAVASLTGAAR